MKLIKDKIYIDKVSKCGILLNPSGKMYIIRDGKKMRLNAFIIKNKTYDPSLNEIRGI